MLQRSREAKQGHHQGRQRGHILRHAAQPSAGYRKCQAPTPAADGAGPLSAPTGFLADRSFGGWVVGAE